VEVNERVYNNLRCWGIIEARKVVGLERVFCMHLVEVKKRIAAIEGFVTL